MCAAYTQWMGEDAAGKVPLPFKFMSLWGLEQTYGQGRYRVFAEYANANAFSLPWDSNNTPFPGYTNWIYSQGYTNGARWVGSAGGSGSQVTTLGWMDAQSQRMLKLHAGTVNSSLGAYDPRVDAPHGRLRGLAMRVNPRDLAAADALYTQKKWDDAIAVYRTGLKYLPDSAHLQTNLTYCEKKKEKK